MQLPQININGTDREDLLKDYIEAKRALEAALTALSGIWPHGRDYQTLEPGAYQRARCEHAARIRAVGAIVAEIQALAESVV
jgi:hypothetical protein